eukprot:12668171-Alexandrium_andersonii.AAC.1
MPEHAASVADVANGSKRSPPSVASPLGPPDACSRTSEDICQAGFTSTRRVPSHWLPYAWIGTTARPAGPVSYTHLRAHETSAHL